MPQKIERALIALLAFELVDVDGVIQQADRNFYIVNVVVRELAAQDLAFQRAARFVPCAAHQNFAVKSAGDEVVLFVGKGEHVRNIRARNVDFAADCLAVKVGAQLDFVDTVAVVEVEVVKINVRAVRGKVPINIRQRDAV